MLPQVQVLFLEPAEGSGYPTGSEMGGGSVMPYRIRNWDRHYETSKTRPLKNLSWISLPIALDSDGYAELMEHENGASHFGTFVAILEVAAHCVPRGCLLRARAVPHDARSLSRVCRIPEPIVQEAIDRLLSIGWIETWHDKDTAQTLAGHDTVIIGASHGHHTGDTLQTGKTLPEGITGRTGQGTTLEGGPVGHNQPGRPDRPGNGHGEATTDPLVGGPTSPESRKETEMRRKQAKALLGTDGVPS